MNTTTDLFPGWCAVAQMGHVCHRGFTTVDTSLGIPMLRVVLPAVAGDETREPLDEQVVLVAPGSLYGVTPTTEAAAIEARRPLRPWKEHPAPQLAAPRDPFEDGRRAGALDDIDDVEPDPVAELAPPLALVAELAPPVAVCVHHPPGQFCDSCVPL